MGIDDRQTGNAGYKRRSPFVPFALRNDTGCLLSISTSVAAENWYVDTKDRFLAYFWKFLHFHIISMILLYYFNLVSSLKDMLFSMLMFLIPVL